MATENILMAAVAAGGDRQTLHELIRQHSQAAAAVVKEQGGANDLIPRLKSDKAFAGSISKAAIDPAKLTGRSKEQVDEFLGEIVAPIRKHYRILPLQAKCESEVAEALSLAGNRIGTPSQAALRMRLTVRTVGFRTGHFPGARWQPGSCL